MGTWTTTPRTWVAGEIPTAANFNSDVRDFGRAFADAWTSYTPTLTAASGTPTTTTVTGAYAQVGKLVAVRVYTKVTNKGTATSWMKVSLPVSPLSNFCGMGSCNISTGAMGTAFIFSSVLHLAKYDGSTLWVDSQEQYAAAVYEAA